MRGTAGPGLGGISGQSPGFSSSADLLPGRHGPKASSASTLVAQRATDTFLVDSLNCSDTTGMEEIRSSGLMPESKEEFPPHAEGRSWDPLLGLASPQYSGQAQLSSSGACSLVPLPL